MSTFIRKVQLVEDGDMSADVTSSELNTQRLENVAVHAIWTGTPTGDIELQYSIDGNTWETVDTIAAGGAAGSRLWNATIGVPRVRVFFDFTSGTGSLNVFASGKE